MRSIPRQDVPVAIAHGDLEVRAFDQDCLMVGLVRLPAGADRRPATQDLPDDLCPCRTGVTCSKAGVRMNTTDGHHDFAAGEAFYCPGPRTRSARGQQLARLLARTGEVTLRMRARVRDPSATPHRDQDAHATDHTEEPEETVSVDPALP
jgi:hypothetical protein